MPRAMPATMHAHMPAVEIALSGTLRETRPTVGGLGHFSLRVAIGRRSIALLGASCMTFAGKAIAGCLDNGQNKIVTQTILSACLSDSALRQNLQIRLSASHNAAMTARERVKQLIKVFPKVYP